jgi:hypothetical protein
LALAVPLSRFTSQVAGGSAFYVRLLELFMIFGMFRAAVAAIVRCHLVAVWQQAFTLVFLFD